MGQKGVSVIQDGVQDGRRTLTSNITLSASVRPTLNRIFFMISRPHFVDSMTIDAHRWNMNDMRSICAPTEACPNIVAVYQRRHSGCGGHGLHIPQADIIHCVRVQPRPAGHAEYFRSRPLNQKNAEQRARTLWRIQRGPSRLHPPPPAWATDRRRDGTRLISDNGTVLLVMLDSAKF